MDSDARKGPPPVGEPAMRFKDAVEEPSVAAMGAGHGALPGKDPYPA